MRDTVLLPISRRGNNSNARRFKLRALHIFYHPFMEQKWREIDISLFLR